MAKKTIHLAEILSGQYSDERRILFLEGIDAKGAVSNLSIVVDHPNNFLGFLRRVIHRGLTDVTDASQMAQAWAVTAVTLSTYATPPAICVTFQLEDGSKFPFAIPAPSTKLEAIKQALAAALRDISIPSSSTK